MESATTISYQINNLIKALGYENLSVKHNYDPIRLTNTYKIYVNNTMVKIISAYQTTSDKEEVALIVNEAIGTLYEYEKKNTNTSRCLRRIIDV